MIDHLWHLTETGYYQRQGGPYPPFTWCSRRSCIIIIRRRPIAACSIFDTDEFPDAYRDKLLMGNIHGGCLNVDALHA